jgi:hypothetical protein
MTINLQRGAIAALLVAAASVLVLTGAASPRADARAGARNAEAVSQSPGSSARAEQAGRRRALYGDLHLHTAFSFDSYAMIGNTDVTPDVAYRFARGEPIKVFGRTLRRRWPLDFMAITDHPENLGSARTAGDPASAFSRTPLGRRVAAIGGDPKSALVAALENLRGEVDRDTFLSSWQEEIDAANRHYKPGTFTTFIGYEWASQAVSESYETTRAIHRNVIFSGGAAPLPFTTFESKDPEDLWSYLERTRAQAQYGDVLAITNHPTASQGLVYGWENNRGNPIDRTYATRRALNEPLSEMANPGGDHESAREVSPDDRWLPFRRRWTRPNAIWLGGTIRDAWGRGLEAYRRFGANPFGFGVVGSTDSHTGLSISQLSSIADADAGADAPNATSSPSSSADAKVWPATYDNVPGPLTGVWAEDNTREAIFAAFRRKETFATSGPRMKLRLFGGWTYRASLFAHADWPKAAYAEGVAMGGDLPPQPPGPEDARTPRFLIWAEKSPEGNGLESAQMIKLSLVGDRYVETIFDLAGAAGNSLSVVWEDPRFDPAVPAVYYLRVLEEPTPVRATVFDRNTQYGLPANFPRTTQERGWTSPIWYWPR